MKKYFSVIASLALVFTLFFSFANIKTKNTYAASPAIIHSGTLPDTNINYRLDENGLLTISGTGVIPNDYDGTELEWAQWKNDITSIVIENGITGVGYSSFFAYTNLTKITLANSVQSIDQSAFANCTSLTEINFPSTMNVIRGGAFSNCTSLESIQLPNGITTLGSALFKDCTNLTNLTIPNTVEEFSSNVFFGCTSLKSLTLPKNITTIDKDYTFNGSHFERIYLPCDSTFNFYLSDYAVSYVDGTTYLSDTRVELLESHNFGNWQNIGGNKKQRVCSCGHTETANITDDDNNLNTFPNKNTNNSKSNNNYVKIGIAVGTSFGAVTAITIGAICFSKRKRKSY